jgi:flagellar FliL protein
MADIPTLAPAQGVQLAEARKPRWPFVAALVVLLAGGGGAWYMLGGPAPDAKPDTASAPPMGPALYVALDPPFVTNFEAEQLVRFLQITAQVMTHDQATADILRASDPVIRNDLLLLFSNQKYAEIATREGKEKLRAEALAAVRKVVKASGGRPERVNAVFFTSFVMQ